MDEYNIKKKDFEIVRCAEENSYEIGMVIKYKDKEYTGVLECMDDD